MAEMTLNIQINGVDGLDADLKEFLTGQFKTEMTHALLSTRDEMRAALAKHVQEDVYDKFSPNQYERRGMNGGLAGQALNATSHADGDPASVSYRICLDYKPDGNHPNQSEWKEAPVHGDDLISRIENWNPKYPYPPRRRRLPRRPFWQKFVDEMVDEGMLEYYIASALREQGEDVTEDGAITRDAQDGEYG